MGTVNKTSLFIVLKENYIFNLRHYEEPTHYVMKDRPYLLDLSLQPQPRTPVQSNTISIQ